MRGEREDIWWVYMIACRGGRIYTGTAKDPATRFRVHREGKGAAFTRANPPVALLRSVAFDEPVGGVPGGGGAKEIVPGEEARGLGRPDPRHRPPPPDL